MTIAWPVRARAEPPDGLPRKAGGQFERERPEQPVPHTDGNADQSP
jgi:hypothetical protein